MCTLRIASLLVIRLSVSLTLSFSLSISRARCNLLYQLLDTYFIKSKFYSEKLNYFNYVFPELNSYLLFHQTFIPIASKVMINFVMKIRQRYLYIYKCVYIQIYKRINSSIPNCQVLANGWSNCWLSVPSFRDEISSNFRQRLVKLLAKLL